MNKYTDANVKTIENLHQLSFSEEVIKAQHTLLDQTLHLEKRMQDKLIAVMLSECPLPSQPDADSDSDVELEWPPLFNELRNNTQAMKCTLDRISALLDRVRI